MEIGFKTPPISTLETTPKNTQEIGSGENMLTEKELFAKIQDELQSIHTDLENDKSAKQELLAQIQELQARVGPILDHIQKNEQAQEKILQKQELIENLNTELDFWVGNIDEVTEEYNLRIQHNNTSLGNIAIEKLFKSGNQLKEICTERNDSETANTISDKLEAFKKVCLTIISNQTAKLTARMDSGEKGLDTYLHFIADRYDELGETEAAAKHREAYPLK
ncbi:MAG: hypothetical protein WC120_00015 [Parcubacteria group bacterium]